MMKHSFTIGFLSVLAIAMAPAADAQIHVGPLGGVNLRLPFVSVDTLPFGGGTRVRAPFMSVNTGLYGLGYSAGYGLGGVGYRSLYDPYPYAYGYRGIPRVDVLEQTDYYTPYGGFREDRLHAGVPVAPLATAYPFSRYGYGALPPIAPVSPYPSPYELDRIDRVEQLADVHREMMYRSARPNYEHDSYAPEIAAAPTIAPENSAATVALRLRQSAARLSRSLAARADDDEVWLEFLQPNLIVDVIDGEFEGDAVATLLPLLPKYEGTGGNLELTEIWSATGFHETHQGLRLWLQDQGVALDDVLSETSIDQEPVLHRPELQGPESQAPELQAPELQAPVYQNLPEVLPAPAGYGTL